MNTRSGAIRGLRALSAMAGAGVALGLLLGLCLSPTRVARGEPAAGTGLQISKSGPVTAMAGAAITYVIVITNATTSVLAGVIVTDTWNTQTYTGVYEYGGAVQVNSFFLSTSPMMYAQFELAPLPANSTGVITMIMYITPTMMPRLTPVVGPAILGNSVVITTSTPGVTANNSNIQTPIVGPLLRLTKSYTPTNIVPRIGQLLTYTFKLENVFRSDAADAENVSVTERLPGNTIFKAAYPSDIAVYDEAKKAVQWSLIQTLPVSSAAYLTLTVQISPSAPYAAISNPAANCDTRAAGMPFVINCASNVSANVDDIFEKVGQTVSPPPQSGAISSTFPNRIMTYTVTVYNPFSDAVTGMIVTDTLPNYSSLADSTFQYLDLVSASAGLPTVVASTTQAVAWSLPTIAGWGAYSFTFRVLVPPQTRIPDNATVQLYQNKLGGNYAGIVLTTNDGSHDNSMKVNVVPQIQLIKTVTPTQQTYGFPVTYTLSVSNSGPTVIRDIVLTDVLPCNFQWDSLVSGQTPITASGKMIGWSGITLTGYAQTTLAVFRAMVFDVSGTSAKICYNTVQGYSPDTYIVRRTNLAPVTIPAIPPSTPPFVFTKTVTPASVVLGGQVIYAITIANRSAVAATMAGFTDTLPAGFYYAGSSRFYEATSLVLQPLQANAYRAAIPVDVVSTTVACDSMPTTIYQTQNKLLLEIAAPPELAGLWGNPGNVAGLQVRPQAQAYKTVSPAAVLPGDMVTFTVTLSNNTSSLIDTVRVIDTLPAGFTFGGMVSGAGPGAISGQDVNWYDQNIPPGGKTTLVFTAAAAVNANTYTNYVKATSMSNSLICIPKTSAAVAVKQGIVEINKSASPTSVGPLGQFNYDITLNNLGPYTGTVEAFTETLPGIVGYPWRFIAMQSGDPTPVTTNPLVWTNLSIGAGKQFHLRFTVRVETQVGDYPNLVYQSPLAGLMTGTMQSPWILRPVSSYGNSPITIKPGVGIAKDASQDMVMTGETVIYTITLANVSGSVVNNLRMTDTLPADFTWDGLVSGDAPAQIDPPVWAFSSVAVGTKVIVFRARVASMAPSGVRYNRVTATAAGIAIAPTGNTAQVEVVGIPTLNLGKSVAPPIAVAGKEVTYTLTLFNPDRRSAVTARLTDTLPPSITFAAMIDGPVPVAIAPQVVWDNVVVPANTTLLLVFRATVAPDVPPGYYYNRLDGFSPQLVFDSTGPAAPLLVASSSYDLRLTKSNGANVTPIGAQTVYTINYAHASNVFDYTVTNIIITDTFAPADYLLAAAPGWNLAAPGVYTCVVNDPRSGASGFVTLGLRVDNAIPPEYYTITNTAEIGSGSVPDIPEAAESVLANNIARDIDTIRGPDLVIVPNSVSITPARLRQNGTMTVVVKLLNQGVDVAVGPDGQAWFGTDLYIKPVNAPAPINPGDRYLGACPTLTDYCPNALRSNQIGYYLGGGLAPGQLATLTYTVKPASSGWQWLYFQADTFWGKNGDPDPTAFGSSAHGRMFEGVESNNIYGPVLIFVNPNVYLPLIRK